MKTGLWDQHQIEPIRVKNVENKSAQRELQKLISDSKVAQQMCQLALSTRPLKMFPKS